MCRYRAPTSEEIKLREEALDAWAYFMGTNSSIKQLEEYASQGKPTPSWIAQELTITFMSGFELARTGIPKE